jgi:hypothetical protein
MTKEERETKKKVSIKNGECHFITPIIKIGADDESDDEDKF